MLRHIRGRHVTASVAGLALVASSALALSTPASARPAPHKVRYGTLQLCSSDTQHRAGKFTIKGTNVSRNSVLSPRAHSTACTVSMRLPQGQYTIAKIRAAGVVVTGIQITPARAAHVKDARTASAQVRVLAGQHTKIMFRNANAPASTPRPKPPTDPAPAGSGYVEVCKAAGDGFVSGNVTITVAAGSVNTSQVVPVGQCTAPIAVPAGHVAVSESAPAPYYLSKVATSPANALVSTNLATSSAIVNVAASADSSVETLVTLTNSTNQGQFKICKTLDANAGDLISANANAFTFDPSYRLSGATSWTALPSVRIIVPALQVASCVLDPVTLPLGAQVKVTEESVPNTTLTSVSVSPASQDAGSTATTAALTIGPNANGITTASFTNAADGTVEICKTIDDSNWLKSWSGHMTNDSLRNGGSPYNGTPFQFSINGGAPITVRAGACSPAISVPAGTATISELPTANFNFESFTAVGPDGKSRLASDGSVNPVTVNVPWGGVGNETLVTATNQVQVGQVKVCKMLNGVPVGKSYTFHTAFSVGNGWFGQDLTLQPTDVGQAGEVCGYLTAPLPIVQPNGTPISVTVTEGPSPFGMDANGNPIVEPTSITYDGNGSVIASRAYQTGDSASMDGKYYLTAALGQGVNEVTFTNSLVLDP